MADVKTCDSSELQVPVILRNHRRLISNSSEQRCESRDTFYLLSACDQQLTLYSISAMATTSKPSPLICWKWPFSPNPYPNPSPASCGDPRDLPWLFKSLKTLGSLAQGLLIADPLSSASVSIGGTASPQRLRAAAQGEAEQRALAAALKSGKEATVLEFYSPKCRLCNSLLGLVLDLERKNEDWVSFVLADAENEQWLPELLHYDIKYVPCFVLLDKNGKAIAKTGVPTSRQHVIAGLYHLLKLKQPAKQEKSNLP